MNRYYVYVYLDPTIPGIFEYGEYKYKFQPFYVGKGTKNRKYCHIWKSFRKYHNYNKQKESTIDKIESLGFDLKKYIILLETDLSHSESLLIETKIINTIGRVIDGNGPLTNILDHGGRSPSIELKIKRSKAQSESWTTERRKKHSERMKYLYHCKDSPICRGMSTPHGNYNGKQISETRIQKFKTGELSCKGAKNSKAKTWLFISPTNERYIIKGESKQFCIDHGLSPWSMWEMAKKSGKFKSDTHRGWKCELLRQ